MSAKERDPQVTHKIMSAIPSKDTEPELMLRKALWKENLRYRVNYKKLPGKPDIVFTKYHIVVFCDGDYWHGHNWAIRGLGSLEEELAGYSEFWRSKILRNIERDKEVNQSLKAQGWTVIRIWESDIRTNLDECVRIVKEALFEAKMEQMKRKVRRYSHRQNKKARLRTFLVWTNRRASVYAESNGLMGS